MEEDKINPNHYKGLKSLFVKPGNEPAQVIDIIEAVTRDFYGGLATNLGNVIKYLLRFNLKGHDSYQKSQFEKNLEELEKIAWYSDRFNSVVRKSLGGHNRNNSRSFCLNTVYKPRAVNSSSLEIALSNGLEECSIFDVYDACKDNYPEVCRESLLRVFVAIDKITSGDNDSYWAYKLEEDSKILVKSYQNFIDTLATKESKVK